MTQTSVTLPPLIERLQSRVSLCDTDRAAILALPTTVRPLRRHETIVREGDRPRETCVVLSGFAIRHKSAGHRGRQIFSLHMRGDSVDIHNSLLGKADHSLQMLSAGEVAFIPASAIRELTLQRANVGQALWLESLVDAAIGREWALNIGQRDARSRLAHLLCEFSLRLEQSGQRADVSAFELPMTQDEVGEALALSSIHVNRTLRQLSDEGLISRSKRSYRIVDWDAVARIGDFDPNYLHLPSSRSSA